jgi:general secretion pathway protein H
MLKDERRREKERPRDARTLPSPRTGEPTLLELMAQEKERVEAAAKYSTYTSPEIEPREFPKAVKVSVWTRHQRDAVGSGIAYLYFFPQGFTERAMVFIRQGNNAWTLVVSPLTGKTSVVGDQLEVPRS